MATGVRKFSSQGREVKKFTNTPPVPADYEGLLRLEKMKIGVADGGGKLPYISVPIELLNTATTEGGKNKLVFHMFLLGLALSEKDGVANVDRPGGLVEFSKATNTALEGIDVITKPRTDDNGVTAPSELLSPEQVIAWLRQFEGVVFKLHTKIQAASQGYEASGRVSYFIEADVEESSDDATGIEEEAPAEDFVEEPEELEELPPPPAKKAAPVAAKKAVAGKRR